MSKLPAVLGEAAEATREGARAFAENGARPAATGIAFGVLGTAAGHLLGFALPATVFATASFAPALGVVCMALSGVGVLRRKRRSPIADVESDLAQIDRLFARGRITRREYRLMRAEILRRFGT
jgi:uncharacterized membrane protein